MPSASVQADTCTMYVWQVFYHTFDYIYIHTCMYHTVYSLSMNLTWPAFLKFLKKILKSRDKLNSINHLAGKLASCKPAHFLMQCIRKWQ